MSILRFAVRRPITASLTALVAVTIACVPAVAASASGSGRSVGSAPAQVSQAASSWTDGSLCLTNARSSCASVQLGTADNAVLGNDNVSRMVVDTNSDGYWEAEFKTYADGNGHFCLASTGLNVGARVSWQHCGANGTVWILEPHNNGAYLVSRYALDHGHLLVLTANGTARFTQLSVNSEYAPGSIYWQTWTFS